MSAPTDPSPPPGASDGADPNQWIAAFADRLGIDAPDQATIDTLLDLAGVAAHASHRTAAPIACYLVGRAGLEPDDAIESARQVRP